MALTDTPSDDASEGAGALTIQEASHLVDVPAPTIRSWERRYGLPVVTRSTGGHRRYSSDQLAVLIRMRDLVAQGRRAVDAAAQIKNEQATSPEPLVAAFVQAAQDLHPGSIAAILDAARQSLGLGRTVDEVILPAMRQIGRRWEAGRTDISHEHLATGATQAWLSTLRQTGPPLLDADPIVLSCGPQDHHTLGLEAIGALLRERGWDCRLLGARTPAESLGRAVDETRAAAVVLVCHLNPGRRAAISALRLPELRHTHVFYAGGAFSSRQARHGVPGHYLGDNLTEAADFITATLRGLDD